MLISLLSQAEIRVPVSLSATFVQKVKTPQKKTVRYTGDLLLNRSREFRWHYARPARRDICGDGRRVRIIDHRLQQVVVYKVGSLLDMMQLLKRAKQYRKDIYLAKYHGTQYTLKIDARGQVEQIAYKDKMDNVINIRFSHVQYRNDSIASKKLVCPVPKSYDVVKG